MTLQATFLACLGKVAEKKFSTYVDPLFKSHACPGRTAGDFSDGGLKQL